MRIHPLIPRDEFDGICMTSRTYRTLQNLGAKTVDDILKIPSWKMLAQPNFGLKSLKELEKELIARGLKVSDMKPARKKYIRAIETPKGKKLFQDAEIARLKWEIYRARHDLECRGDGCP